MKEMATVTSLGYFIEIQYLFNFLITFHNEASIKFDKLCVLKEYLGIMAYAQTHQINMPIIELFSVRMDT